MNKVVHVLVIVFLLLAAASLYFELQLKERQSELTDRLKLQNEYLVKIAKTIEKEDAAKDSSFEIKKDASPVEARAVDPDMDNVLESYQGSLEKANLATCEVSDNAQSSDLDKVFERAKKQQTNLNTTRSALAELRGKLESVVSELNKVKPEARQDKVTIEELNAKAAKFDEEKAALENQVTKIKGQIGELNGEITSLKDEVATAKDETEAAKEDLAKAQGLIEQLKKLLKESISAPGAAAASSGAAAVTALPAGDKGKIIKADNENMFAIVEFSADAILEMKGGDASKPLPSIDLGVKRPGFSGDAGEFVGRIHLRQEVKGKNYVICDILGAWEQSKLIANDIVFAD